jgi:hypothetical protein
MPRIAPAPAAPPLPKFILETMYPVNKYKGVREEVAAYKAAVQERKAAAAAAAAAAAKPPKSLQKSRRRPNAFSSTFKGLLNEYCSYYIYLLKDCCKSLKKNFLPTLCCLRAEIRDN